MRKKLLLLLCMMIAVFILLVPCAFADGPNGDSGGDNPPAAVTEATIDISNVASGGTATYSGATSGDITSAPSTDTSVGSEITNISVTVTDNTIGATEIEITGVGTGSTNNTEEGFYAGATIGASKNFSGTSTGQELDELPTASATITVEGEKIDTDNEGLNLYSVSTDGTTSTSTFVKTIEDTNIVTKSGDDTKSVVTVNMESLYNFMLMKYSKYNSKTIDLSSTDGGKTYTGSTENTDNVNVNLEISVKSSDGEAISGITAMQAQVSLPTTTYLGILNATVTDLSLDYKVVITAKNGEDDATSAIPTSNITHKLTIKNSNYAETNDKALSLSSKSDGSYTEANTKLASINATGTEFTINANATNTDYKLTQYSKYDIKSEVLSLNSANDELSGRVFIKDDADSILITVKDNGTAFAAVGTDNINKVKANIKIPTENYENYLKVQTLTGLANTDSFSFKYILELINSDTKEAVAELNACEVLHEVHFKNSKYADTDLKAVTVYSKDTTGYSEITSAEIQSANSETVGKFKTTGTETEIISARYDKYVEVSQDFDVTETTGFSQEINGVTVSVTPTADKKLTGITKITAKIKTAASRFLSSFGQSKQGEDEFSNWFVATLTANDSKTIPEGIVTYKVIAPNAEVTGSKLITLYRDGSSSESRDELSINGTEVTITPTTNIGGEFLLVRFDPYSSASGNFVESYDSDSGKYTYTLTTDNYTVNTTPTALTGNKLQVVITSDIKLYDVAGKIITGIDDRYIKYVLSEKDIEDADAIKAVVIKNRTNEFFYGGLGYSDISANDASGNAVTLTADNITFQIVNANTTSASEVHLYDMNSYWKEVTEDTTRAKSVDTATSKTISIAAKDVDLGFCFVTLEKFTDVGTVTFADNTGSVDINRDGVKSVTITKDESVIANTAKVFFPTQSYLATEELFNKNTYFNTLKLAIYKEDGSDGDLFGSLYVDIVKDGKLYTDTQYVSLYEESADSSVEAVLRSDDIDSIVNGDASSTIKVTFSKLYTASFKLIEGRPVSALKINGTTLSADQLKNGYSVTVDGETVLKYMPEIGLVRLIGYQNKEASATTIDATGNLVVDVAAKTLITGAQTAIKSSGSLYFIGKTMLEVAVNEGVTPISTYTARDDDLIYTNNLSDALSRKVSVRIKTKDANGNALTYATGGGTVQAFNKGSYYSNYGFESGLLLTTGGSNRGTDADRAEINAQILSETNQSANSYGDIGVYQFTMEATGTKLSFDYIFASSEFTYGKRYNDAFGLFVDVGDGEGYKNIAKFLSPVTNEEENITMSNLRIAIGAQDSYGNPITSKLLSDPTQLQYKQNNYYTKVYTANIPVEIGKTVKVKYVITDVGDSSVNSFVMIREGSFTFESQVTFDDGLGNLKTATVTDGEAMSVQDQLKYFTVNDPDPYGSKVGYKKFDNANGKWYDQDGNEITKTYTNWATVSKVTAKYELAEYCLDIMANGEKCGQIDFVYAIDWSGLRDTATDLYAPNIKGYKFVGWDEDSFPTTKPASNKDMQALVAIANLEAKTFTLTLEDYWGRRSEVQVKYGQVIPDVAPAAGFDLTIFTGYYYDGVQLYDSNGHANGYVWNFDPTYSEVVDNVHTDEIQEEQVILILAKARYVTMNAYRWDKYKTYDINSDEDLTMKYKFTSFGQALDENTISSVKIYINGTELSNEYYALRLGADGTLYVDIDKEFLKKLGAGKFDLMTTFFMRQFVTELTISDGIEKLVV